jgi:hypothetical protein
LCCNHFYISAVAMAMDHGELHFALVLAALAATAFLTGAG